MPNKDRSIDPGGQNTAENPDRWAVIRDIGVLQVKLVTKRVWAARQFVKMLLCIIN